jgi:hypothetical protein
MWCNVLAEMTCVLSDLVIIPGAKIDAAGSRMMPILISIISKGEFNSI